MIEIKPTSYLTIAGFTIQLQSHDNSAMHIDDSFDWFFVPEKQTEKVDLKINVHPNIPREILAAPEIFHAPNDLDQKNTGKDKLWSIHALGDKFLIFTAQPEQNIYPYEAAIFDMNFKTVDLYCLTEKESKTEPLSYPMAPLILYYLAIQNNALVIHASGVHSGDMGMLFSGVSGIGKSTMASIWAKNNGTVINDDRLIVRKQQGNWYMHNSPMFYKDKPKKALLSHIFLLKQSLQNRAFPLEKTTALVRIMAYCIQHDYHKQLVDNMLDTLSILVNDIPAYELGFYPDNKIVEYLQQKKFENQQDKT